MIATLADEAHVQEQRERYRARRSRLEPALRRAGFRIDDSEAGLYLWATKGQPAWDTVAELAELGILVVPGDFYGDDPGHPCADRPDRDRCRHRGCGRAPRASVSTVL